MLIVMHHEATPEDVEAVCARIRKLGFEPRPMPGEQRTAIGLVGNDGPVDPARFHGLPGVLRAIPVSAPYKQVSLEWQAAPTIIELANGTRIGGDAVVMMGGPCSVETERQLMTTAEYVAAAGATVLRGGAYKPRTSPYSFQGLGEDGLKLLAKARDVFGLAVITEALDEASAEKVAEYADIIQIGARNMQNFGLLKHVGRLGRPVMLKRGHANTVKEWLLAAEYIVHAGNPQVMLCERGIRGFDNVTRNVFDVSAIAVAKTMTHLPVIGDPSHGTGKRELIVPMARAAVAAGADGLIVETHPEPTEALSDGQQALYPQQFHDMVRQVGQVAQVLGRPLAGQ
ncbi:MAG: 3-deoxy-7-phosphoheptulonate synthase [Myxococcales bacterium]|nr:3-deoxy-7-phosphoheptulonate synthase [Myxococcales bacterium]MCB9522177.1 3-deoxy-7-phosphoheptulonate synthase [Myxococcales bacterium]